MNDADRWAEAVEVALRETTELIAHRVDTWWTHKYIIASNIAVLASLVLWIASLVPMTAQSKVVSLVISPFFLGMAGFWTIRGTTYLLSTTFEEEVVTYEEKKSQTLWPNERPCRLCSGKWRI